MNTSANDVTPGIERYSTPGPRAPQPSTSNVIDASREDSYFRLRFAVRCQVKGYIASEGAGCATGGLREPIAGVARRID